AIPDVTDANNNGIADTTDYQNALDAVKKAQAAETAAEQLVSNAKSDNNVSQTEADSIIAKNAEIEKLKADAQKLIEQVPESDRGTLQNDLNAVNPVEVPPVTKDLYRLTSSLDTNGGPDNPKEAYYDQKYTTSSAIKTTENADHIYVHKGTSEEYGGFIDGGTGTTNFNTTATTVNTAGGDDLIDAVGMGGNVKFFAGDGNDTLKLQGISGYGPTWNYYGGMDGAQVIDMGTGNDTIAIDKFTNMTRWSSADQQNSFYYSTTKILMGDGKDTLTIAGNIKADSDSGVSLSNYFNLGSGDDTMTIKGNITDTESANGGTQYASNLIDLGSGHDTLTIGGSIMGNTLVLSEDSSTIKVNGAIVKETGNTSFKLGSGNDTLTIEGIYDSAEDAASSDSLAIILNAYQVQGTKTYLSDWYSESESSLQSLLDANSRVVNGNTIPNEVKPFVDLGDGNNQANFNGGLWWTNVTSGSGSDTITVGSTAGSFGGSKISTGAGDDTVSIRTWYGKQAEVDMGNGDDTINLYNLEKFGAPSTNIIQGGEGYDVLNLKGGVVPLTMYTSITPTDSINLQEVEEINLNGTGSSLKIGENGLTALNSSTDPEQYGGAFYIHGTSKDSVTFDTTKWAKSQDNVQSEDHPGHTYDVYQYNGSPLYVYVEDGITIK
ncbi:GA-like domain-containing protein, partial [Gallibacterium anatis]